MPGKTDQELIEEAKRRRAESELEADALKLRGFGLSEGATPDEAAKALELARKNGVPRVSVETDIKGYRALDELERVDKATRRAPALRKWLADGEDNYAIARDDAENLSLLEHAINAANTVTKFALGTPRAAKQGIMDIRTQAYGEGLRYIEPVGDYSERLNDWQARRDERRILQRNEDGTMSLSLGNLVRQTAGAMGAYDNVKSPTIDRKPERPVAAALLGGQNLQNESEYLKAWANVLKPWQDALSSGAEASAREADALNPETGDFVADSALSGVRSLTNMVAALIVASRAGPTAGAAVMGAQVQGQSYAEARFLSGLGVQDSVEKSNADAAIELATERISLGVLDDIIASNKPILQKFLAGMAAEQVQEQAATFGQDFVDWQIVNPDKTAQDFLMERPERAAQTAIATLVASGGMQATLMGLDSLLGQRDRGAQTEPQQQAFQQMRDLIEKSPVFTRSREAVRDFVEQASEGQTVHLDDEGVTQLYQSSPEAFAQLMDFLGMDAQETYLRAAQGNDIEISAAALLTLPERADYDALVDITRTSPDALTPAEIRAQAENDALNVDLEDLQARLEDDMQAMEGFERVQQSVQKQLIEAGRSPQEAEAAGAIWGSVFRVLAEDGVNEAQVFERLGLRIQGQEVRQPAMQEPQSLLSFVKARGGIREAFGQDERGYMRGEMQAITGTNLPGLINNKGGQTLDEMAMLAREAGYDIADDQAFIDAMQRELGGEKVYRTGEGEAWRQYQESKAKAQQGDAETLNQLDGQRIRLSDIAGDPIESAKRVKEAEIRKSGTPENSMLTYIFDDAAKTNVRFFRSGAGPVRVEFSASGLEQGKSTVPQIEEAFSDAVSAVRHHSRHVRPQRYEFAGEDLGQEKIYERILKNAKLGEYEVSRTQNGGFELVRKDAANLYQSAKPITPDMLRQEAEQNNAELDKEAKTVRQMLQEAAACASGVAPAGVGQMVAGLSLSAGAGIPLGIIATQMTPQAQDERERRMKEWNLQEHQRLMKENPEYRAAHEQYDARMQERYDNALAEYRAAREFEQKLEAYSDIDNMPADSQFDMNSWTEQVTGVSGEFLDDLIGHEADGDWQAQADTSSAKGGGQFIDSTWLRLMRQHGPELGLDAGLSKDDMLALRTDRRWGTMMTAYYAMENRAALEKKLDRPVTQKDAYLAHFLGSSAAAKALSMDPQANAAEALPAAAEANRNVFYKYGNLENPRTVGEMIERQTKGFSAEPLMVWDYPEMMDAEPNDGRVSRTPGLVTEGNINLHNRPVVKNADGTISTVRTISIGTDQGEVVIPTVSEDGRIMSDEEAIQQYRDTGRHFGIFDNVKDAEAFAQQLHEDQAKEYGK